MDKRRTKKLSMQERVEKLTFFGTGDEAYELFQKTCELLYLLDGAPQKWREQIFAMAKEMAEQSERDYQKWDGPTDDPRADKAHGHYGRCGY